MIKSFLNRNNLIDYYKCGKKIKKKQEGGNVESSKPTKTHKVPFIIIDNNRKKKITYVKDEATRDSLYANRYYDDEVLATKPGNWVKGKWTPDRSKAPYKTKKGQKGLVFQRQNTPVILESRKYQFGGKYKKPFTGFEDLTYEHAPAKMSYGRSYRPEEESILTGNKSYMTKYTDYDTDVYEDTGKMQQDGNPYYDINNQQVDEPNNTQVRLFNNLKRHAIMNQKLGKLKFQKGGDTKKIPYKSMLGYTQDRGGGTQYVHRVYPENDSYYIDMQYNQEGLTPSKSKRFMHNPTGAEFDYDAYDYSNTVPAKKHDYHYNPKTNDFEAGEGDFVFFNDNGDYDPSISAGQVIQNLRNQNMPLVEPRLYNGNPSGYRGVRIYR